MTMKEMAVLPAVLALFLSGVPWVMMDTAAQAGTIIEGEWEGTYTCLANQTGLRLKLIDAGAQNVDARFIFYPTAKPEGITFGEFMMSGQFNPQTGQIDLKAGGWIKRPIDYVTVDLQGALTADGSALTGRILYPGCTDFTVVKRP